MLLSALLEAFVKQIFAYARQIAAIVAAAALVGQPLVAAPSPSSSPLGTIVSAERAHIGTSAASLGSTLFGGDRISTDAQGTVQVRAGAARLKLWPSSSALLMQESSSPAAILTSGGAIFSTANANAFSLHALDATIKPNTNAPTIGQVMILGKNELLVKSTRGALVCSVDGEERVIGEGEAYRVELEGPSSAAPGEQGPAGSGGNRYPPIRPGRSRAIYFVAAGIAAVTVFALLEALESPDRP
jgi:hypothetical protein